MKDFKIIYVVTSGEYENYGIEGVFDNKYLAEDYMKIIQKNTSAYNVKIEEYELNPSFLAGMYK